MFWRIGGEPEQADPTDDAPRLATGGKAPLGDCAAGWMVLSTLPDKRRAGLMRRFCAEAPDDGKIWPADLGARVEACRRDGFAHGPAGFGADIG